MTRDSKLLFESYARVVEAQAQQTQASNPSQVLTQAKRLKDMSAFTSNLVAIDAFEDKTNDLFNTAIKTGFLTQQEATQAKQLIGFTIYGFLISLVSVTQVTSPNQLEQMKKAISDKIKGIDVTAVLREIDRLASGGATATNSSVQGAVADNTNATATPSTTDQAGIQGAVSNTNALAQ